MKGILIGAMLMLGAGVFILARAPSVMTHREVLTVGDMHVSAEESQTLPRWLGGALIAGGIVAGIVGLRTGRLR